MGGQSIPFTTLLHVHDKLGPKRPSAMDRMAGKYE